MNIMELIAMLEEQAEMYGEDIEVKIAEQPSWPFQNEIDAVVVSDQSLEEEIDEMTNEGDVDGALRLCDRVPKDPIVYLVEGEQDCYLPSHARYAIANQGYENWIRW